MQLHVYVVGSLECSLSFIGILFKIINGLTKLEICMMIRCHHLNNQSREQCSVFLSNILQSLVFQEERRFIICSPY
jgi:hypothetical protein